MTRNPPFDPFVNNTPVGIYHQNPSANHKSFLIFSRFFPPQKKNVRLLYMNIRNSLVAEHVAFLSQLALWEGPRHDHEKKTLFFAPGFQFGP